MANFTTRRRRLLTSITLGSWLFAFFVATVHACGLYGEESGFPLHGSDASAITVAEPNDDPTPGCEEFCATVAAAPVSKVQTLSQMARSPYVPLRSCPRAVSAMRRPVTVQFAPSRSPPLPDVDLSIRFVRFALGEEL